MRHQPRNNNNNNNVQSTAAAASSESENASSSPRARGARNRGNFDTIRPSIYVKKEQRKHEFENRLKEQAAGGYNHMRRQHQKSLRQVCYICMRHFPPPYRGMS